MTGDRNKAGSFAFYRPKILFENRGFSGLPVQRSIRSPVSLCNENKALLFALMSGIEYTFLIFGSLFFAELFLWGIC